MNATIDKQDVSLFDHSVQAALEVEMAEARMSSDQNLKHRQYLGTIYSSLTQIGKFPKCRKALID